MKEKQKIFKIKSEKKIAKKAKIKSETVQPVHSDTVDKNSEMQKLDDKLLSQFKNEEYFWDIDFRNAHFAKSLSITFYERFKYWLCRLRLKKYCIILDNVFFQGCDFRGADLRYVSFKNAHLKGCNFVGANISCTNFEGANLEDTILYARKNKNE